MRPYPYSIILGSASPRRKDILSQLNYQFKQISLDVNEEYPKSLPSVEIAEYLSRKKAKAYQEQLLSNELLITADTTVCLLDKVLNKPSDEKEAFEMLSLLSGKEHKVVSGVCLSTKANVISFSVSTKVVFKELSKEEILFYIKNYQPFDKAGAYGIQEWIGLIGVKKIEGSYFNVMGLPSFALEEALCSFMKTFPYSSVE